MARKAAETAVDKNISEDDPSRSLVSELLVHSIKTAKSHYVHHSIEDYVKAMSIINEYDCDVNVDVEISNITNINKKNIQKDLYNDFCKLEVKPSNQNEIFKYN